MKNAIRSEKMNGHVVDGIWFAAVGDVHGAHHEMVRLIQAEEQIRGVRFAFVLQVGDFGPHRHDADVRTMAAPARYRVLGDFPDFHRGRACYPWPVYFIGGNHEPYGYLEQHPEGALLAPNCHYLGRTGLAEMHGLRIAGLSGIYRETRYDLPRPQLEQMHKYSPKEFTGFTRQDVARVEQLAPFDILLAHEWPAGLLGPEGEELVFEHESRRRAQSRSGSRAIRALAEYCAPQLLLCGHRHVRYNTRIPSVGADVQVWCLDNVVAGALAVAVFSIDAGRIEPDDRTLGRGW